MKTKTGALSKSAGFPGKDMVKKGADKSEFRHSKDVFGMPVICVNTTFRDFYKEQLRQSDEKHKK